MTTNLLICYNHYPLNVTVSATTNLEYDENDLNTGDRRRHWKGGSGTSHTIKYYTASGFTVDYFIVAKAHYLVKSGASPTFTLAYSDNDSAWSEWYASSTLTTADLTGPNNEDYIHTGTLSDSHPYWRLTIAVSPAMVPEISKFYCGAALDLGRDPASIRLRRSRRPTEHKGRLEATIEYTGISYSNTMTVLDRIATIADYHPIFLYTQSYAAALGNVGLLHCQVLDVKTPQQVTAMNDITLVVRELV